MKKKSFLKISEKITNISYLNQEPYCTQDKKSRYWYQWAFVIGEGSGCIFTLHEQEHADKAYLTFWTTATKGEKRITLKTLVSIADQINSNFNSLQTQTN